MKYIQIPTNFNYDKLEWGDVLVFAYMSYCKDPNTYRSWPNNSTISDKTDIKVEGVIGAKTRLIEQNWIQPKSFDDGLAFIFDKYDHNYIWIDTTFITNPFITRNTREFLLRVQPYIYKADDKNGVITKTPQELAILLNSTEKNINRYFKLLQTNKAACRWKNHWVLNLAKINTPPGLYNW